MRIGHSDFMRLQVMLIRQHMRASGKDERTAAADWIAENGRRLRQALVVY